jgi:hypothetical protein
MAERVEKDIIEWNDCWYVRRNPEEYNEAKNAAMEIITQAGDDLSWFLRKINYTKMFTILRWKYGGLDTQ